MDRVVRIHRAGDASVLKLVEEAPRSPEPDEVLVRIGAIGLNRAETLFREDQYIYPAEFPSRIGLEGVGTIEAVGSSVKDFSVGERIATLSQLYQPREGTYGDHVTIKAENIIKATKRFSDVEEAAVWNAYLTSYGGLIQVAGLTQGQSVLLTAATSSVGLAAITLAKNAGAQVIATTRNPNKKQALLDAGADIAVVTETESVVEQVLNVTAQMGVDIIFDPIAGVMVQELMDALRPGGRYIVYGLYGGLTVEIPMFKAFEKLLNFRVYSVYELMGSSDLLAEADAYLRQRFEDGQLLPHVGEVFGLSQVSDAHRVMESNRHIGKLVLTTEEGEFSE